MEGGTSYNLTTTTGVLKEEIDKKKKERECAGSDPKNKRRPAPQRIEKPKKRHSGKANGLPGTRRKGEIVRKRQKKGEWGAVRRSGGVGRKKKKTEITGQHYIPTPSGSTSNEANLRCG